MRVLDTFMTILVLGILSSTIAQEQIPSGDESGSGVTEGSDISDSDGSAMFGITAEELAESLAEDCEENGGPTALGTFIENWETSVNCTGPVFNLSEFETDRTTAISNRKWDTFARKYCGKLPAFLQCVNPTVGSFKACLDPDNQEILGNYWNISSSFLEFLCQNNGDRIISFHTAGGAECLESKQLTLQQDCLWEVSNNGTKVVNVPIPFWVDLGQKECEDIEKFGTCTIAVLRTCENPTSANIVESIVNWYKTWKSCPTIPAAQESPAT